MPTETLAPALPDSKAAGLATPFSSTVDTNPKRLSAVERLEADKAKYVKSQEVINAKQEPIKPPVLAKPPVGHTLLSKRGSGIGATSEGRGGGAKSAVLMRSAGGMARSWTPSGMPLTYRSTMALNEQPPDSAPSPSTSHSLRSFSHSLKVLPLNSGGRRSPLQGGNLNLSRRAPHSRSLVILETQQMPTWSLVPRWSVAPRCTDLRAGGRGPENFARANSDIVSLNFRSASMISSDCDRSRRSSNDGLSDAAEEEEEEAGERVPYGISAVERNARVIKWLYSIKQ
ncbi:hypothetical protein KUCAC02_018538, partial [Chaenocephalus aceratus]